MNGGPSTPSHSKLFTKNGNMGDLVQDAKDLWFDVNPFVEQRVKDLKKVYKASRVQYDIRFF